MGSVNQPPIERLKSSFLMLEAHRLFCEVTSFFNIKILKQQRDMDNSRVKIRKKSSCSLKNLRQCLPLLVDQNVGIGVGRHFEIRVP